MKIPDNSHWIRNDGRGIVMVVRSAGVFSMSSLESEAKEYLVWHPLGDPDAKTNFLDAEWFLKTHRRIPKRLQQTKTTIGVLMP